jgi:DNA-dependent metalloprotease WSS1
MNMGEKILVRLRPHYDPDAFLPEESIVGTMLHEVRTIVIFQLPQVQN